MILDFLMTFILQANAAIPSSTALEILSEPTILKREESVGVKKNETYPSLIQIAFSQDHSIPMRWKALTLAAKINPEASQKEIEKAVGSREWFMRNAALMAMKISRPEKVNSVARKLLKDKALVVRSAAVASIDGKIEADLRKDLWSELDASYNFRKGQSLWVRNQIVEKLSKEPLKDEYGLFAKALAKKSDEKLYSFAIEALEEVTRKKLGTKKSSISEKRNLWIDYTNKNKKI